MNLLLERKEIKPFLENWNDISALFFAARRGYVKIVRRFLEIDDIDVNYKNSRVSFFFFNNCFVVFSSIG